MPTVMLLERDVRWLQREDAMATEKLAECIPFFREKNYKNN